MICRLPAYRGEASNIRSIRSSSVKTSTSSRMTSVSPKGGIFDGLEAVPRSTTMDNLWLDQMIVIVAQGDRQPLADRLSPANLENVIR